MPTPMMNLVRALGGLFGHVARGVRKGAICQSMPPYRRNLLVIEILESGIQLIPRFPRNVGRDAFGNPIDSRIDTVSFDTPEIRLAEEETLLPGLVDTHVHVNEPGRTEWEGFSSATRAAAAGGVTTLIDMPLNSIPSTVSMDALSLKQRAAQEKVLINVGFWGGAVPDNLGTGVLEEMWEKGKVFGFKCFLADSGVDEFPPLSPAQLEQAMREIAAFDGQLIVHAELEEHMNPEGVDETYESFLDSRPPASERSAVELTIDLARKTECRTHILHLSDAGSLRLIRDAQAEGVKISAETCPHYLSLFAEEIYNGSTEFKCCPPVREAKNRELGLSKEMCAFAACRD